MIEVIPAINAESFEEVEKKIRLVEPYVNWVHLDVADGTYTPNTLWHNPEDLLSLSTKAKIEVHLMIADVDNRWLDWTLGNINRIIFHHGASHDPELIIQKIQDAQKEAGIALQPDAEWKRIESCLHKADLIQTLAVSPGIAGQKFVSATLDKIRHIRSTNPKAIIEADGGINLETGKQCVEAGANILVAASYIFGSNNIEEAIKNLKNL